MKVNIKSLFFFLLFFVGLTAFATQLDSGEVPQYQSFEKETLEDFRNDGDFQYERLKSPSKFEPWEWLLKKLQDLINSIFGVAPSADAILNIIYITAALVMLWVIVKLVGVDITGVFKKSKRVSVQSYQINEENLHNIDFEKEMEAARNVGQLRLLIRLQYLYVIKGLSTKGIIEVKGGKTNHDYLYEIGDSTLRSPVASLSRIFEYTWYGNFEVHTEVQQEADRLFTNLKTQLG